MELTEDEAKMESVPENANINVKFYDNIAIIEMNYGENRVNFSFVLAFHKALDEVERNPKVEALITTGNGKFYCNGVDVQFMSYIMNKNPEKEQQFREKVWYPLFLRILTFPVPTIAAINGHCFAGGAFMALFHDYRIMQTGRGYFCLNEVRLGLPMHPLVRKLLQYKVPSGPVLNDLAVMGKRFSGDTARTAGIVVSSCKPAELIEHSVTFARSLLSDGTYNREYLSKMKEQVYEDVLEMTKVHVDAGFGKYTDKAKL